MKSKPWVIESNLLVSTGDEKKATAENYAKNVQKFWLPYKNENYILR